jgi:hypothetical protein
LRFSSNRYSFGDVCRIRDMSGGFIPPCPKKFKIGAWTPWSLSYSNSVTTRIPTSSMHTIKRVWDRRKECSRILAFYIACFQRSSHLYRKPALYLNLEGCNKGGSSHTIEHTFALSTRLDLPGSVQSMCGFNARKSRVEAVFIGMRQHFPLSAIIV